MDSSYSLASAEDGAAAGGKMTSYVMEGPSLLENSLTERDGPEARRLERHGANKEVVSQFVEIEAKNMRVPPILTIEAVAALLSCSVQWVRGISANELPRHRVGKRDLYIRDEIVTFVRARGRASLGADELVREAERQVLGSTPDSERRRPSRRAENASRS